jgi:hypothetical protein
VLKIAFCSDIAMTTDVHMCMLIHGMAYLVCALYVGLGPTAITPTSYVLSAQDPYAVGIPLAGTYFFLYFVK